MINTLPYEIASQIYGYLSIDEVTSVDIAYKQRDYNDTHHGHGMRLYRQDRDYANIVFFTKLFNDRISMNLYLGQHFSDSEGLLRCMLINDIILSGSRSLEYFVPGSTDEDSDWDFYADGNQDKIFRFMEFMKSMGVKWLTALEWFIEKLEDHATMSSITSNQVSTLLYIVSTESSNTIINTAVKRLFDRMEYESFAENSEEIEIDVKNSKGYEKTFMVRKDQYSNFNIINGTFNNHGKIQSVQLFYTSALQCGITGFCAFHMYAKDAYNRQSRLWIGRSPDGPTKKMKDSRKKYEKRGYLFYESSFSTMEFPYQANVVFKRHLKDPDSHVIDFNTDGPRVDYDSKYNVSQFSEFVAEKRMKFYEFSWIQNGRDLMVDEYHITDIENAKKDAIQQFIQKVADSQPDPQRKRQMLSTLRDLSCHTGRFRAIADPIQTMLESQEKMPDQYLNEFVNLSISE
jgi:hypothetical protein